MQYTQICQVNNITLKEKKMVWGILCTQCMACIQWCPQNAISHALIKNKRSRYIHPYVTAKQIGIQNAKVKKNSKVIVISLVVIIIMSIFGYQPLIQYLTGQAANPHGFVGKVITRIWSNYFKNLSEWGLATINLNEYGKYLI
ncbi:hypothetical protein AZF37_05350 [endosymbiont 'TC1' of Trimyema compressum]|uniref:hypothetical protein n=1 Tax=endosymbiont 'TC1' of Trimyema compressum TaxID=243899 RepID=UPI0007F16005|nr:hypothetical protein [endosymbiont 'TC1' of Trimyema compressum]AMP20679.1 hypothetical protein AZF37_05350 [endosymbiont 'TC1' of Trimyema compressum]